jgi:hypothetical protein
VALLHHDKPITPIGCEVVDGKLWALSWDEEIGEVSGATAVFEAYPDALSGAGRPIFRPRSFRLPKRALPHDMAPPALQKQFAAALAEAKIERDQLAQRREARIAEPRPDHLVAILPQRHPEVDPEIAREAEKQGVPFPETDGSVVMVRQPGSAIKAVQVGSLSPPLWDPRMEDRRLRPPARAISVAWQDNGEIWIGVAGERKTPGGLWHSADAGQTWQRVDAFSSVTSIDLRDSGKTVAVAEQGIRQPRGTQLVSERTRMMERTPAGAWTEIEAPPHDHDSEIEICGTVADGPLYARVGERLYRQGSRPFYRSVADVLSNRR